jgi:DNA-binding cell septation regulator SpoVG
MSDSTLALLIFIAIIIAMIFGIWIAIVDKKRTKRSGSFASMAVFHDMQSKEKQNVIEAVIEKQAEKKWEEQESGDDYTEKTD